MINQYVGKNRVENRTWLINEWLENGPSVCFLQGFAGVGKTSLVNELINHAEKSKKWVLSVPHVIADKATPSIKEELMELATLLSEYGFEQMEKVLFKQNKPNLAFALEKILQHPVIIVLDESQRWFKANSGSPLPELEGILDFLRGRPTLPGRLLLVSDREVEEARWSEWIPIRKLSRLTEDEAINLLELRIAKSEVSLDISEARKLELVQDLDFNPRAIEALVSALHYDSLDELIESNPSLWSVKDREVSPEFLRTLEKDILQRTIKHLDKNYQQKLQHLSVYRRGFDLKAIESVCDHQKEMAREVRKVLIGHYFLSNNSKFLLLNPIVREISLAHLRGQTIEFKKAHAEAANYYARPFHSQQIIDGQKKLSLAFAELRYHCTQAENVAELKIIGRRFTDHLRDDIKFNSPIPVDSEELNERIGTLTALLELDGSKSLFYYLACCLEKRKREGDINKAIVYAKKSLDNKQATNWIFLANLLNNNNSSDEAISLLKQGIEQIPPDKGVVVLYQACAKYLADTNKVDEAIYLLREGITKIPPDKAVVALYQACADLLNKIDKTDEAISLLKNGIVKIPLDKDVVVLYQACAKYLADTNKVDEAIYLLREGITKIPPDKAVVALYQACANLLVDMDKTDEAIDLLQEGIAKTSPDKGVVALYQACANLLADMDKTDEAICLLQKGIAKIPPDKGVVVLYQACANLLASIGKTDEAIDLLQEGILKNSPDKAVVALYHRCADLLDATSKVDEAIYLLKQGIARIPPDKAVVALYHRCADLLDKISKTDTAILLLKDGVNKIPVDKGVFSIYKKLGELYVKIKRHDDAKNIYIDAINKTPNKHERTHFIELAIYLSAITINDVQKTLNKLENYNDNEAQKILGLALQDQLNNQWNNAAERVYAARTNYSSYLAFARVEAYSYLVLGQEDKAWQVLENCPNLKIKKNQSHGWLAALIHLHRKDEKQAKLALEAYLGREINENIELNKCFLLKLWEGQITEGNSGFLRFYYPNIFKVLDRGNRDLDKQLDIYISYAWGEDDKNREDIVDELCQKLKINGKQVGRDKDRIKSGDSIEEFANEIAKAKYIITVISKKYLQSEWCMLYELYQAYKRCGEKRGEFQKKVIALVMDDAKDCIDNSEKGIEQAQRWQNRHQKLSEQLEKVDPNKKHSRHLWEKLDAMEEMYRKIPDMLDAIRDIAMKRGYEEILKNNFAEVIERVSN